MFLSFSIDELKTLNETIAVALKDYGDATSEREKLYDGPEGLKVRIPLIKEYLASFTGGKKGQKYVEFTQAMKGV
ncbi:MAG TPA: hypothetical protein VIL99_06640 [Ignavibacteria bacterium]